MYLESESKIHFHLHDLLKPETLDNPENKNF